MYKYARCTENPRLDLKNGLIEITNKEKSFNNDTAITKFGDEYLQLELKKQEVLNV